jgi:hypothetical protein
MKKQTAVEWLDNRLKDESVLIQNSEGYYICIRVETLEELINQAKEMEREQYYNQTFKSESYQQKMRDKIDFYKNKFKSE